MKKVGNYASLLHGYWKKNVVLQRSICVHREQWSVAHISCVINYRIWVGSVPNQIEYSLVYCVEPFHADHQSLWQKINCLQLFDFWDMIKWCEVCAGAERLASRQKTECEENICPVTAEAWLSPDSSESLRLVLKQTQLPIIADKIQFKWIPKGWFWLLIRLAWKYLALPKRNQIFSATIITVTAF